MTWFYEKDRLADGPKGWAGKLLQEGLGVRNKQSSINTWYMSMGAFCFCACLWPARGEKVGGATFWSLAPLSDLRGIVWEPVIDYTQWVALECEYVSLAHVSALLKGRLEGELPAGMWMQTRALPNSLLQAAAKKAFWSMGVGIMDRLMKDLGLGGADGRPFAQRLFQLIQHILKTSDEHTLAIMELRTMKGLDDFCAGILNTDEAQEAMSDELQQQCAEKLVAHEHKVQAQEGIHDYIRECRLSAGQRPAKKPRKAVQFDGDHAVDPSMATAMCPPGGNIFRDRFNGRWRAWKGNAFTISRSWGLHSEVEVVRECLRALWDYHTKTTGEACWVRGLEEPMAPAGQSESSAAGSRAQAKPVASSSRG